MRAQTTKKMKKVILKSSVALFALVGMFFVDIPEAEAADCRFLYVTENPLFAVYDCDGTLITVMRGAEIKA
jgi:hypothetical protein